MGLVSLCARRMAIIAALTGGFMVAVLGAGLCANGVVSGGNAFAHVIRSAAAAVGW